MKIVPVVTELFHADGQTDRHDMTKLTIAFQNVSKAHENQSSGETVKYVFCHGIS